MSRKYFGVFLALLIAGAEANPVAQDIYEVQPRLKTLSSVHSRWEDTRLSADINQYVDSTIGLLVPFIQNNGLDPMELPEVVEGFSVRPILITYSAWLKIHNGKMTGLVNIERSGDQMVNYVSKILRVDLEFKFSNLRFDYDYLVQVMSIGPTGGIVATLASLAVRVDVLVDFNNDEIHLQNFALDDIGRLRVRLTGNLLTDWLVNPVLDVFVRIFDETIIEVVERNMRHAIQSGIIGINNSIKDVIERIESYDV